MKPAFINILILFGVRRGLGRIQLRRAERRAELIGSQAIPLRGPDDTQR
jgi:hypothetical protein